LVIVVSGAKPAPLAPIPVGRLSHDVRSLWGTDRDSVILLAYAGFSLAYCRRGLRWSWRRRRPSPTREQPTVEAMYWRPDVSGRFQPQEERSDWDVKKTRLLHLVGPSCPRTRFRPGDVRVFVRSVVSEKGRVWQF
jgi:hypothetical protein